MLPSYERDIRTYARTDVTSRRTLYAPLLPSAGGGIKTMAPLGTGSTARHCLSIFFFFSVYADHLTTGLNYL